MFICKSSCVDNTIQCNVAIDWPYWNFVFYIYAIYISKFWYGLVSISRWQSNFNDALTAYIFDRWGWFLWIYILNNFIFNNNYCQTYFIFFFFIIFVSKDSYLLLFIDMQRIRGIWINRTNQIDHNCEQVGCCASRWAGAVCRWAANGENLKVTWF